MSRRSGMSDPGSPVWSRHTALAHRPHVDDPRTIAVSRFLDGRPARHVCLGCVAAAMRIPLHDATAMVAHVGTSRGYRLVVGGRCHACGSDGVTVETGIA